MPINPRGTSAETAAFMALYHEQLGQADCPSARIAYLRAEALIKAQTGQHRYKDYATFKTCKSCWMRRQRLRRIKTKQVSVYGKTG